MDATLNVSRPMDNSMSMINQSISTKDSLDLSGKMLDRFFAADDSFPTLIEKMQITKSSQYQIMLLKVFLEYFNFVMTSVKINKCFFISVTLRSKC